MPRLSRAQEAARRQIADWAAGGLPPESLAERVLAALQSAIPADGMRLFGVDPATLLFNRLLAASHGDELFRQRWLRDIYLAHGPVSYLSPPPVMRLGLPVTLLRDRQEHCWGLPTTIMTPVAERDHARVFHETLTPAGGFLRTCLAAGGRWIGVLDIIRRSAGHPLRPTDAAFLRLLSPMLGQAIGASLARERALSGEGPQAEASGILLLNRDKHVRYATPAGEAWLERLRDTGRDGHPPLPTAVWSAVAGLRLGADGSPASVVVAPTPTGPVRIEASSGGLDGSIAVVLAPLRPPSAPEVPDHWPLTVQERRVATLLAQGSSNRQIAAALNVTEKTVEAHLGHVFEKVGVSGRTQLLARLFRETFFSAFLPPSDEPGGPTPT